MVITVEEATKAAGAESSKQFLQQFDDDHPAEAILALHPLLSIAPNPTVLQQQLQRAGIA